MEVSMIPVDDLFESHLDVTDLHRSMSFFWPNAGIRACGGVGSGGLLSIGLVGEATRCSVCGGRDGSPEAKPSHCLSGRSHGSAARRCASSSSQCCSTRLLGAADRRTGRAWMDARCNSLFS